MISETSHIVFFWTGADDGVLVRDDDEVSFSVKRHLESLASLGAGEGEVDLWEVADVSQYFFELRCCCGC